MRYTRDIKELYQPEVDEIVRCRYVDGVDFYDLVNDRQLEIFNEAMLNVNERLQAEAEMRRELIEDKLL